MRNFSEFLTEARFNSAEDMLQSEVTNYINKVKTKIPQNIKDLIALTSKYNLLSVDKIDEIRGAHKGQLDKLAIKYNIPIDQLASIYELIKSAGRNIRLLPQYQTPTERAALEAGRLATDDLTIDLDTQQGRNAAAKLYTPIVLKIVAQYIGKSKLDRPSLISAGMEGLTDAMNDWNRETNDNGKKTTFRTYASYRIQQAILNEINANGHDLSGTNWYASEKYGAAALDAAFSIDGFNKSGDDDFDNDHLIALGADPTDPDKHVEQEEKMWKDVFKALEAKFSTRDMDIFYRYTGLGPYHGKREKSKDIAKDYGMSEGNIRNSIINKILKYIQSQPRLMSIMSDIRDMYTESILRDSVCMDAEMIKETLYNDTLYIMLEELTRWNDKRTLEHTVLAACDKLDIHDAKFILDCLTQGMEFVNTHIHKNKRLVVAFLSDVYPSENMSRKNEGQLADYMNELIEGARQFNIQW